MKTLLTRPQNRGEILYVSIHVGTVPTNERGVQT